jgi:hypothetical protein
MIVAEPLIAGAPADPGCSDLSTRAEQGAAMQ